MLDQQPALTITIRKKIGDSKDQNFSGLSVPISISVGGYFKT